MLRFIQSSDWHLTQGKLWDETLRCLEFIAEVGEREKVDAYLLPGDFTHSDLPHRVQTPTERNALRNLFRQPGQRRITYGNHDVPGDLDCFDDVDNGDITGHIVYGRAELVQTLEGYDLLVVPYPHKRHWLANRVAGAVEGQRQELSHTLGTTLRALAQQRRPGVPLIGLAHLNIAGSKVGGGEVMIGSEIELSPADLDEIGCTYWALGHIHQQQQVSARGFYAGTPQPHSFGDSNDNVCLLVEIEGEGEPRVTRIELPSVKLYTVRVGWHDGRWHEIEEDRAIAGPFGKAARWRAVAQIDEADREVADWDKLAKSLPSGTRIEKRIIPTTRVRSEQIRAATTVDDKLRAYWQTLEPAPADEEQSSALDVLGEIA